MKILFIGNYQQGPGGEAADETHLARELESLGHTVYRVARDEWREYVLEDSPKDKYKIPEDVHPDIIIIAKWHHFFDGRFIDLARKKYECPVFYWVWDLMEGHSLDDWHMKMCREADLYLSGELGMATYYHNNGVRFYYFQFDSCDGKFPAVDKVKKYDVVYIGSCNNQNGRLNLLKEINNEVPIHVFGYDFEEWRKQGFNASPAVYGQDLNEVIAESKIILGTSAGGPKCFGYWSNRVGKTLHAGGFLLQLYAPGMELFLADSCEYFSNSLEAIEKIKFYLNNKEEREKILYNLYTSNRARWTSEYKVRQLSILIDRYLKTGGGKEWMLP